MIHHSRRVGLLAVCLVLAVGCAEDTAIRSYSVARQRPEPEPVATEMQPAQMLGVILPHQQSAWFFKLVDDPDKVLPLQDDFRRLADSLTFGPDGAPAWTLADGWQEQVLRQITYAQFQHPSGATVTLTQLGANTADAQQWQTYLKDNINRWRQQLSLNPQDWSAMQRELEEVPELSTPSAKAYFVSLTGRRAAEGQGMSGRAPFMERMQSQAASAATTPATTATPTDGRPALRYQVPEGWLEVPVSGIRLASFTIGSGEPPEATVVVSTAGGSLEQSIGMWLQQVGREPEEEAVREALESATTGQVRQADYRCFTIHGAEQAATIRVAVIPLSDQQSMFVKMTGSAALVEAQREQMDQFVASLSW